MKLYKLTFKCISSMTKIPDAQTIFGAVCNIIKYTKGEDELQRYFESFKNEPLFVHSSMFLDGLMPMVKVGLISIDEKNKQINSLPVNKQLTYLSQLKKLKKISFVSLEIYNKYIVNGDFIGLKLGILNNEISIENGVLSSHISNFDKAEELLVHNNHEEQSDERRLYYDKNLYYSKNCQFCIYVKTNDIEYVKSIFKYAPYFGFGSRVSVGKNCFKMESIEEIENVVQNPEKKVLLSKCISNEFDLVESSYVIDSTVYWGSKSYSSNVVGRFNRFVEGSYMKVNENKEYYGDLIRCNNGKVIYHYGIGFTL
ncbi:hypothetical protein CWE04_00465 [Thomasclavelia cocleata]|uniref:CRISPR system Cms protein Csm4 n=1 Tax=Thomasclavelia cocleata TaxID=69824 RepID=A0A1I0F337_9FIRM|nr:hypothetical protein [Thomasclavelia cocleata]MCR1960677.1 hypothetical protein [Thomasclavelia cocleata]NDO41349.1 hypothetical protein [Thomasclavelia cocleata]PJN81775.1 hypothetical protein CWE04_00465 [Thomasclavelia cocleata]SET52251.1 CRISPR type III-A/MTUBE-associated RAMP protein Csm4 [Thomasclavelia cocleata]